MWPLVILEISNPLENVLMRNSNQKQFKKLFFVYSHKLFIIAFKIIIGLGNQFWVPLMYNNFKNEVNKRRENPDKPHTKTGNAPEDINNKNYETSETFEMEVIA